MIQHGRPEGSEHVAIAARDDVVRVTRGRPNCWVSVHEIARRLALDDQVVERAVDLAIDRGWLVGDGYPPHSVRLAATSMQELS
ncbi:MAG: hypothetical protein GEV13_28820 [Rhodospirillales bacterium]|nr:hypothetical protein [Rhodospirillales bacterium]